MKYQKLGGLLILFYLVMKGDVNSKSSLSLSEIVALSAHLVIRDIFNILIIELCN